MILQERTHVHATAEQVWAVLRDPRLMSQWNPQCVYCDASEGTMRVGLRFKATMHFGAGPARLLDCEVIACEPQRILTLRFSGEAAGGADEYVEETYGFQPVEGGTKVLHQIDFSHSGLPRFLQVVLKVVHLVGQPQGKSPLDGLKERAEVPATRGTTEKQQ
ncbi:MAG: SRPBCC family protein [Planctomycetes bacterium]|nr:SRPBCC family protein [Planctomycetota bacterium]